MLSVEQFQEKLNAPFEEGRDEPTRCYSRREAERRHREAHRFIRELMQAAPERPAEDDDPERR